MKAEPRPEAYFHSVLFPLNHSVIFIEITQLPINMWIT